MLRESKRDLVVVVHRDGSAGFVADGGALPGSGHVLARIVDQRAFDWDRGGPADEHVIAEGCGGNIYTAPRALQVDCHERLQIPVANIPIRHLAGGEIGTGKDFGMIWPEPFSDDEA